MGGWCKICKGGIEMKKFYKGFRQGTILASSLIGSIWSFKYIFTSNSSDLKLAIFFISISISTIGIDMILEDK